MSIKKPITATTTDLGNGGTTYTDRQTPDQTTQQRHKKSQPIGKINQDHPLPQKNFQPIVVLVTMTIVLTNSATYILPTFVVSIIH